MAPAALPSIIMLLGASLLLHAWGEIKFLKKDLGPGPGLSKMLPFSAKAVHRVTEPNDGHSACPGGSRSSAEDAWKL